MKLIPLTPTHERILNALKLVGVHGLTCDEIEQLLNLPHQSCSARLHELTDMGAVQETRRRRLTRHGRLAAVVVLIIFPQPPAPAQASLF